MSNSAKRQLEKLQRCSCCFERPGVLRRWDARFILIHICERARTHVVIQKKKPANLVKAWRRQQNRPPLKNAATPGT